MEVQAPYGYVLDSTPVPFTVSEEQSRGGQWRDCDHGGERGYATERPRSLVTKTGEEFSSVQVSGDGVADKDGNLAEGENLYTPVYCSDRAGRSSI